MDIRKLQRVIVDGLEDVKAQNIQVFNTEHLSPLFERVIVASGTSNRQTRSLAASVRDAVKLAGAPSPRTEGEDNGEWIIVDCGQAVVHVMQPAIREYYHLEELWGDKPVRMKLDGQPRRASAAAARDDGHAPPRRAKPAPARRSARAEGEQPAVKKKATAKAAKKAARPPAARRPRTAASSGARR
ncbi:MAG: ribosome silencing factor [Rhizobacter sp.]|nr:ribosome silencing factor [Rhizobacter sp.]